MKITLKQDIEAAWLYMEYWQREEGSDEDANNVGWFLNKGKEIMALGYPNPARIVFDNEAEPLIIWKSKEFDWYRWRESLGEDSD